MKYLLIAILAGAAGAAAAYLVRGTAEDHSRLPATQRLDERALAEVNESIRSQPRARSLDRRVYTDPRDAQYDPVDIATVLERSPRDLFEAEPVDEAFAVPRAALVASQFTRDLATAYPEARVLDVDCRTSTCRAKIEVALEDAEAAYAYVQTPPMGDLQQPRLRRDRERGLATIELTMLFSRNHRDHSVFEDMYRARRTMILGAMRQAGRDVPDP